MESTWQDLLDGCCSADHADEPVGWSRRQALVAAGIVPLTATNLTRARGSEHHSADVVRSALHVHSSFSEGAGSLRAFGDSRSAQASMESQAASLAALGFDLCMFTDHDHRMAGQSFGAAAQPYPSRELFAKPTWTYHEESFRSPASGSIQVGTDGLTVRVTAGREPGTHLAYAAASQKSWNYRTTLAGMTLDLTATVDPGGWADFWVLSSYRPATGGRQSGSYAVQYRLDPAARSRSISHDGNTAIVTIPVVANRSGSVRVVPTDDLAAAFPDLGLRALDFGLYGMWFGVTAPPRGSARALFQELRLTRGTDMPAAIDLQRRLLAELAPRYPGLTLAQGLELSYGQHLNWLATSGVRPLPPRHGVSLSNYLRASVATLAAEGGVASYNHLFGANIGRVPTGAARAARIKAAATAMLGHAAYGCQVLEVGYNLRGDMDLAGHIEVWDVLLAAGLPIYANGASDNHAGTPGSYAGEANGFATDILAPSSSPTVAVPALGSGRAFVSHIDKFGGLLDLACNGAQMGGTARVAGSSVDVAITATDLPSGSSVRAVQYAVHGDRGQPVRRAPLKEYVVPVTGTTGSVVRSFAAAASYVRVEVVKSGAVIAFSNPIFLSR